MADSEDDDAWMEGDRSKKTGRFYKGRTGNPNGRPRKPKADTLPYELAKEVLAAGQHPIDVKDRGGRAKKLPALQVVLRQLSVAAAKGDKTAARLFMTYTNNAARTMEQRSQRQFERLGAYLRSVDQGKPWRLDAAEAAFYQRLADEAGIEATIRAEETQDGPAPLTQGEITAIVQTPNLWRSLGSKQTFVSDSDRAEIVRRAIYAYRKYRLVRGMER